MLNPQNKFRAVLLGLLGILLVSCEHSPAPRQAQQEAFEKWVISGNGGYRIGYQMDEPIEVNQSFAITLKIEPLAGHLDAALTKTALQLQVSAAMPHHHHGMNVRPVVHANSNQVYQVEPLRFHMAGRWQLYIDITNGAFTERAEIRIDLGASK